MTRLSRLSLPNHINIEQTSIKQPILPVTGLFEINILINYVFEINIKTYRTVMKHFETLHITE